MFKVFITNLAKKEAKKLPKEVKIEIIDLCENYIAKNPFDAKTLKRPLDECRSFHFKSNGIDYRIAYRVLKKEKRIDVILIKTRENFYKRLKMILS